MHGQTVATQGRLWPCIAGTPWPCKGSMVMHGGLWPCMLGNVAVQRDCGYAWGDRSHAWGNHGHLGALAAAPAQAGRMKGQRPWTGDREVRPTSTTG